MSRSSTDSSKTHNAHMAWLDGEYMHDRYWRYNTETNVLQKQVGEYYEDVGTYRGHETVEDAVNAYLNDGSSVSDNQEDGASCDSETEQSQEETVFYEEMRYIYDSIDFKGDIDKYKEACASGGCCLGLCIQWLKGIHKHAEDPVTGLISAETAGKLQCSDDWIDLETLGFENVSTSLHLNFDKALSSMFSDKCFVMAHFQELGRVDGGHCIAIYKPPGTRGYYVFDTSNSFICWVSGPNGYKAYHSSTGFFVEGASQVYLERA
ncbi:MAG: hypothetical protein AAGA53_17665 [Pseudomonadota bacterium]